MTMNCNVEWDSGIENSSGLGLLGALSVPVHETVPYPYNKLLPSFKTSLQCCAISDCNTVPTPASPISLPCPVFIFLAHSTNHLLIHHIVYSFYSYFVYCLSLPTKMSTPWGREICPSFFFFWLVLVFNIVVFDFILYFWSLSISNWDCAWHIVGAQ